MRRRAWVISARVRADLFDYSLPAECIAQRPREQRSAARLLVVGRDGYRHHSMRDWPELVPAHACVVLNDTKVFKGRLSGQRSETGGRVELLLLRRLDQGEISSEERWSALLESRGRLKPGARIDVGDGVAKVVARRGEAFELGFETRGGVHALAERWGEVPLPPYIRRGADASDEERYQTVFAERVGSVAAPTAGLHLTAHALARLAQRGIEVGRTTLHVGAGTFLPVRTTDLDDHPMHSEHCEVSGDLAELLYRARSAGRPVVAVGTTVVRALESACNGGELRPFSGDTRLLIQPGYRFRVVDGLLTNFHAPRTTLLALVAALIGRERLFEAYAEALGAGYRFLSYGDAMWIPEHLP